MGSVFTGSRRRSDLRQVSVPFGSRDAGIPIFDGSSNRVECCPGPRRAGRVAYTGVGGVRVRVGVDVGVRGGLREGSRRSSTRAQGEGDAAEVYEAPMAAE